MRVLMLAWEYPPHLIGGMGKHVAELAPALEAAGVTLHVVAPWLRGGQLEERLGERSWISRVPTPTMPDYGFISFAQETNRHLEARAHEIAQAGGAFDVIHGHDWLTSYATVALKYAWHVPLLTTIHATERGRGRGRAEGDHAQAINGTEWWLTHESWRVVVCSAFMADQIHQYFATPHDKIDVIPNGVHEHTIAWTEAEKQAFRRQFVADDETLVFTIARLVHEKGVDVLVEAMPHVLVQRRNVKFVIAGMGHLKPQLERRAAEMGIADRVFFTGFIDDMVRDQLYSVADVAVFPSLYEPFGIVALEAMAAHCPVVVSDTGGLSEVVRLYETGLTVYPDNPESLAWGILHTLNHQDEAAARAARAYATIEQTFNWPAIARQTMAVYQRTHAERLASPWGQQDEGR